jgi:formylmethanofuran--tetrahydromethanopterin N-formyltransferase
MDGEFLVQEAFSIAKAVGGGNFLILAESDSAALQAARAAVEAMRRLRGVILPFPGGAVRSGSKVGSRYKFLNASTNTAYCPTIRGRAEDSRLPRDVNAVLEIVIDGLSADLVKKAMEAGLNEAVRTPGVVGITAGNYGGKLGKHHFYLRELLPANAGGERIDYVKA